MSLPALIDVGDASWTSTAFEHLKSTGFARLRLTPSEAKPCEELYDAMQALTECEAAKRQLEVPDEEFDDLDNRSGFVGGRKREMFEFHPYTATDKAFLHNVDDPVAAMFLKNVWAVNNLCQRRCEEALREVAGSILDSPLSLMLAGEETKEGAINAGKVFEGKLDGIVETMLRIYRYSPSYDDDIAEDCGHYDMGLLTLIPKSTSPGLQVSIGSKWVDIEENMGPEEALLFGGMTLARLTGIPALLHRVYTGHKVRFSAPFFQRVGHRCFLPTSPGFEGEEVKLYNRRLRDASNDELRPDGTIAWRRRRHEDSRRGDSRGNSRGNLRDSRRKPEWHADNRSSANSSGDYGWNANGERDNSRGNDWTDSASRWTPYDSASKSRSPPRKREWIPKQRVREY